MMSITSLPGLAYLNSSLGLDTSGDGIASAEDLAASPEKTGRSQDPTVLVENAATGSGARVSALSLAGLLQAGPVDTRDGQADDTVSLAEVLDQVAAIVDRYRSFSEVDDTTDGTASLDA